MAKRGLGARTARSFGRVTGRRMPRRVAKTAPPGSILPTFAHRRRDREHRVDHRLDRRQQRLDLERLADKLPLIHVDEAVRHMAGIARDLNDLDPAPSEPEVAHGDADRGRAAVKRGSHAVAEQCRKVSFSCLGRYRHAPTLAQRGQIEIVDGAWLETVSCECYGVFKNQIDRFLME
jgi:hypothetical protein